MKPADHCMETGNAGHLPGMPYGVDNSHVGAAGENYQSPPLYQEGNGLFAPELILLSIFLPVDEKEEALVRTR